MIAVATGDDVSRTREYLQGSQKVQGVFVRSGRTSLHKRHHRRDLMMVIMLCVPEGTGLGKGRGGGQAHQGEKKFRMGKIEGKHLVWKEGKGTELQRRERCFYSVQKRPQLSENGREDGDGGGANGGESGSRWDRSEKGEKV